MIEIRFDPGVNNKCTDTMHIDCMQRNADSIGRSRFETLVCNDLRYEIGHYFTRMVHSLTILTR